MKLPKKSYLSRMAAVGLTAALMPLGMGVVAPTSAQAVPGSLYGYYQCHGKGNAYKGSLFGYDVIWGSYTCAKTTGGYRLNVYNVRVANKNNSFVGKTYKYRSECKKAGARMKGTYKGQSVRWKEYACSYSPSTDSSTLYIDGLS